MNVASQHVEWIRSYEVNDFKAAMALAVSPSLTNPYVAVAVARYTQFTYSSLWGHGKHKYRLFVVRASDGGLDYGHHLNLRNVSQNRQYEILSSSMMFMDDNSNVYFSLHYQRDSRQSSDSSSFIVFNKYNFVTDTNDVKHISDR